MIYTRFIFDKFLHCGTIEGEYEMLNNAIKRAISGLQVISAHDVDIYNANINGGSPDRSIRILEEIRNEYANKYTGTSYCNAISYCGWQTTLTLPCVAV